MSTTEGGNAPLVTILVPCYQYGRYLKTCLDGIFAQTIINEISFEIIVINDGSTDETDEVMYEFNDPRIRYIRLPENQGICNALAQGITLAKGKYFARIDADDRWKPHFLEEVLPILEKHPDVGLVYGDVIHIDKHNNVIQDPSTICSIIHHNGRDFKGDEFFFQLMGCSIGTAGVIGRTSALRPAIPFPSSFTWGYPSDWWLHMVVLRDHQMYYTRRVIGEYRMHAESMTSQGKIVSSSYEETMIGALDILFSEGRRASERRKSYAYMWTSVGNIHFERNYGACARRAYMKAVMYRPDYIFRKSIVRHFLSSLLPRPMYEVIKKGVKKMF